jgi:hypothetical protein
MSAIFPRRAANLSWKQGSNGGSPLTSQTIHVYTTIKVATLQVSPSANPATISGLTPGVSYRFTVSATNSLGSSPESLSSNSVIPKR